MLLAAWATMADAAPSSRSQLIEPENYAQETYLRYGFADAGYRVLEQIPLPPPGGALA